MGTKYPKAAAGGDGVFRNRERVPESEGGHGDHRALREPAQVGPDPADGPIGDDDLEALSYRRLQEVAKARGVSASGSRDELIARLSGDTDALDENRSGLDYDEDAVAFDDQPDED